MAIVTVAGTLIRVEEDMDGGVVALVAMEDGSVMHVGLEKAGVTDITKAIQEALVGYVRNQAKKSVVTVIPSGTIISVEVDVPDDHSTDDPNIKSIKP